MKLLPCGSVPLVRPIKDAVGHMQAARFWHFSQLVPIALWVINLIKLHDLPFALFSHGILPSLKSL